MRVQNNFNFNFKNKLVLKCMSIQHKFKVLRNGIKSKKFLCFSQQLTGWDVKVSVYSLLLNMQIQVKVLVASKYLKILPSGK